VGLAAGPKLRVKAVWRSAFRRHARTFSANAAGFCGRSAGLVRTIPLTRFRTNRGTAPVEAESRGPDSVVGRADGAEPVRRNHIAAPREKMSERKSTGLFSSCSGLENSGCSEGA